MRAALDVPRALRKFNRLRAERGLPPIDIGTEQRMEYIVIGDTVNVASRLEGLAKSYGHKILANERVYLEGKEKLPDVDLGTAQVKGKESEGHTYGVVEPTEDKG